MNLFWHKIFEYFVIAKQTIDFEYFFKGGHILFNVGRVSTPGDGAREIEKILDNGSAMHKFTDMMVAQGVAPEVASRLSDSSSDVWGILPAAKHKTDLPAPTSGEQPFKSLPAQIIPSFLH